EKTLSDEEFEFCIKKCKSYLERDRYGKLVSKEMRRCMESIFVKGYKLGKRKWAK
ncbi:unnamed protein product, partial [marine sediment metagenome]